MMEDRPAGSVKGYSRWVADDTLRQMLMEFESLTAAQAKDLGPEVAVLRSTLVAILRRDEAVLGPKGNPAREIVRVVDQIREIIRTNSEVRMQEEYVQLVDALALRRSVEAAIAEHVPDAAKRSAIIESIRIGLARHVGQRVGQPALLAASASYTGRVQPADQDSDAGGARTV